MLGTSPTEAANPSLNPMASRKPHFPAKAKAVIYLFMAGGPSQLELFDHKPKLEELNGKTPPDSFMKGRRFAFSQRDREIARAPTEIWSVGR